MLPVDIQEKKNFATHHLKGALETNAYPVESEAERRRLLPALEQVKTGQFEAVVVVCPRGKGGAKRTYEFLRGQGVPEGKLFILTNGMENWPHQTWVEANCVRRYNVGRRCSPGSRRPDFFQLNYPGDLLPTSPRATTTSPVSYLHQYPHPPALTKSLALRAGIN